MIAYSARTGTRRNLEELRRYDWRLIVSSTGVHRTEGFQYAIDNGAWHAYQSGKKWDEGLFRKLVESHGAEADFIVLPDIVEGGLKSLDLSVLWLGLLGAETRKLIAVQDGMTPEDVVPYIGGRVGIFVGGSTEWKLTTLPLWGELSRETKCWLHVGRVNTVRRIHLCGAAGATSFDGSGPSRFSTITRRLEMGRRQSSFFFT